MNQFAIYTSPGGTLLGDYSHRIQGLTVATNGRGFAEAHGFIPMGLAEAFQFYDRAGLPHVMFNDQSSGTLYEGRLEDVSIVPGGIQVGAYGYARCTTDIPYTALWSTADNYDQWREFKNAELANFDESLYQFDTNGRLFITAQKGLTFGTTGTNKAGGLLYDRPNGSSRQIIGVQFNYNLRTQANWSLQLLSYTLNPLTFVQAVWNGNAQAGTGIVPGAFCATCTACDRLVFRLFYNAADAVNNQETGYQYLEITNLRVVTTTTNMVNTTLTSGFTAGNDISAVVGSTVNMYVGQRIFLGADGGANIGFTSIIESIPDSTHFVADWPLVSPGAGTSIKAMVVYSNEVVKDMLSTLNAVSGGSHLATSTAQIQNPGLDLLHEDYADQAMDDVLEYLASLGDNQTTPRQWEWLIGEGRILAFQPKGTSVKTWYVDAADGIEIDRTLDALANSMYAVYQNEFGNDVRSAVSDDSASIARYGIVRRQALPVRTTSATQAAVPLAAALNDRKDPKPKSGIAITNVYDAAGQRWPLAAVRAADTIVVRNLPPLLSLTTDRSRSFQLARVSYTVDTDELTVEPETPLPTLDALLARLSAGLKT